ncbi:hypothetical protein [Flammeovirga kamogawensis]|uniref:Uncharacterized protein n=1 Tax=Flammeovirga kamogawensis TaxID=373891 RepID=A0ABX8GTG5_9BACT|nr:hypothetical protein [Flammeovirga kamogawensis]MBB6460073.1 hypothetical protein [Flammeovirga kamogawensis]QWG06883.1 hypothetical protein KM029_16470 [Flammeovirga kamogawensis]TRX68705.1 hypothetical protein EO216_11465 [Flammeovirga kamogawensis]
MRHLAITIFLFTLIIFSCEIIPKEVGRNEDYHILLEFNDKFGNNLLEDQSSTPDIYPIDVFYYQSEKKIILSHQIVDLEENDIITSVLVTNALKNTNQTYYIQFNQDIDTVKVTLQEDDKELLHVGAILYNSVLIDKSKDHKNRSHFSVLK